MREYLKFLTESMTKMLEDVSVSPLYSMIASKDIMKGGNAHAIMMDDLNIYDNIADEDFEDGFVILGANQEEETIKVLQKIDLTNLTNMMQRISPETSKEDVKTAILEFINRVPYRLNKRIDQNGVDIRGYYQLENVEDAKEEGNYLILTMTLGLVQPTGLERTETRGRRNVKGSRGLRVGKAAATDEEPGEEYEPSPEEIEAANQEAEMSYRESKRYLDKLIKD